MPSADRNRVRLSVDRLDARDVPASFGIPWSDPTHLTVSFAPDGTSAAGEPSDLVAKMTAQLPGVWRSTILRAAQTWAAAANLSIGVVPDTGAPFGDGGTTQGDKRFGDIRIGGLPMAEDALGEAIPPDPLLSGTMAGDVFFNTATTFTQQSLYSVALHEIGHALGLAPSTNPTSVMFNDFGDRTVLSAGDVTAIRALYGAPTADATEGSGGGNNTRARATRLDFPSSYNGQTPLVGYGRLGGLDTDYFTFKTPSGYTGKVTVRVQTTGLSLLTPRLSVYDGSGRLLGRSTGSGAEGDTVSVTLPKTASGRSYFARIDDAPGAATKVGRFGIAVTFDQTVQPLAITVDEVLRGPYEALDPSDIAALFRDPDGALYHDDHGGDDTDDEATDLEAVGGRFAATASFATAGDVDFYRLRAPKIASNGGGGGGGRVPLVLAVTARAVGPNGAVPTVEVFDRDMNPMEADVLRNGNGEYAVQVPGAESDRRYYLRWSGAAAGNFAFEAAFRRDAVPLETFVSGSVSAAPDTYKLYAARTQLFGFTLGAVGPAGSAVRMTITSVDTGATVFDLTAPAGETVSARSLFLAPGEYDVTITPVGEAGPVDYWLRGAVETDPLGPRAGNTALGPKYQNPSKPGQYLYPGNLVSFNTFLFAPR